MKRAIASASLLALGAASAAAQLINADKPWSISGSLRGFYDDNINTQPSGPGRVDSFGFEIIPAAEVNFSSGPTTLKGSFTYDNRYYFERRNTDQSLDLGFEIDHNFSARYSVEFTEDFIIGQEPQVLAGSGPVATPLRSNGDNIHNAIGLTAQAQLTRLFGLVLSYHNDIYSYAENHGNTVTPTEPSRSALLDVVQHTFKIDSTWALTDKTRGIFGYQFVAVYNTSSESVQNDSGPGPLPPPFDVGYPYGGNDYVPADSRNSYQDYVYVGADHTFSPYLSGTARVGLIYQDDYLAGAQQPNGAGGFVYVRNPQSSVSPYADLSLNYSYGDGGVLAFGFTQNVNQTDVAASSTDRSAGATLNQDTSTVYLTATQKLTALTPRLTASGSLQYQYSVFNGGPSDNEADSFYMLGLDLAYQFNPHLSAEAGYNFSLLSSDLPGRGYSRNQLFAGVKAAY
jgi:hypothetical protein